ncbi:MAG: FHA domain-containing protein [Phycisphaerales bacterium JB065]
MTVNLVVFTEDGSRRDVPLKEGTHIVGRTPDAGVRIPLPSVSRRHCELTVEGSDLRVRDLGSSNGTFQNYKQIEEATLAPGDVLGIGGVLLTVQIDGMPANVVKPEPPLDATGGSSMMTGISPGASGSSMMADSGPPPMKGSLLDENDGSSLFDLDLSDLDDEDEPKL